MLLQLIMGYISCIGFGVLFNNKPKNTFIGALAGAASWLVYLISVKYGANVVFATFFGALILGFICENFAVYYKDAAIVFLVPAILPLVPGAGVYFTMRYLINSDINSALIKGFETLGCAVAIAIGIMLSTSIVITFKKVLSKV